MFPVSRSLFLTCILIFPFSYADAVALPHEMKLKKLGPWHIVLTDTALCTNFLSKRSTWIFRMRSTSICWWSGLGPVSFILFSSESQPHYVTSNFIGLSFTTRVGNPMVLKPKRRLHNNGSESSEGTITILFKSLKKETQNYKFSVNSGSTRPWIFMIQRKPTKLRFVLENLQSFFHSC